MRIQQIIAYESGVADVVDALGGSYYLEALTCRLEEEANKYLETVEKLGGAAAAIEQGYQVRQIHESAYRYQKEVDEGQRIIVGVNKYISQSPRISVQRVGAETEIKQKQILASVKKQRDNHQVKNKLNALEKAASGKENIMPVLIECAEAYVTIGEMCDVFRRVFGTQQEVKVY